MIKYEQLYGTLYIRSLQADLHTSTTYFIVINHLVSVNTVFKRSARNKLQYNAIVSTFKNDCIQCDNIDMIQYMSLCFIL